MDTIVDAINLNHEGLQYLFAADDERAISSLTKAIMLVQKWAELDQQSLMSMCDDDSIIGQCSSNRIRSPTTSPTTETTIMQPTSRPLPFLDDNMFYIYNRPITIDVDSLSSIVNDIANNGNDAIREYSACIIFNVALAYHRHGMKHLEYAAGSASSSPITADNNNNNVKAKAIGEACIQKAKTLYCTIIKLLCVASSSSPLNMTHKSSMVVFLAAHNNLSQILRNIVGQIELANEGMHCIATLVDQLRDHHQKQQIQQVQVQYRQQQQQQQQQQQTNSAHTITTMVSHSNDSINVDHMKATTASSSNGFALFQPPPVSPVDTIRECIDGVERNLLVISCAAAPVA